jgi:hypothetical protein
VSYQPLSQWYGKPWSSATVCASCRPYENHTFLLHQQVFFFLNLKLLQIPKIHFHVHSRSSSEPVLTLLILLNTPTPCFFVTLVPDFTTVLCIHFLFLSSAWCVFIAGFIQCPRRDLWKYEPSEKRHMFYVLGPYGGE